MATPSPSDRQITVSELMPLSILPRRDRRRARPLSPRPAARDRREERRGRQPGTPAARGPRNRDRRHPRGLRHDPVGGSGIEASANRDRAGGARGVRELFQHHGQRGRCVRGGARARNDELSSKTCGWPRNIRRSRAASCSTAAFSPVSPRHSCRAAAECWGSSPRISAHRIGAPRKSCNSSISSRGMPRTSSSQPTPARAGRHCRPRANRARARRRRESVQGSIPGDARP